MVPTRNPSTQVAQAGGSGVQRHLWLNTEPEANQSSLLPAGDSWERSRLRCPDGGTGDPPEGPPPALPPASVQGARSCAVAACEGEADQVMTGTLPPSLPPGGNSSLSESVSKCAAFYTFSVCGPLKPF